MTAELATEARPPGVYEKFGPRIDWELLESEIDWDVVPATLGPTWDRNPFWKGPRDPDGYILPEHTLGWQVIHWIEDNLLADETDENDQPLPFQLTNEQIRFLLWFYAIDEFGRFKARNVVFQRLKGAGKDPLASCIAAVEFIGPCRFAGWATKDLILEDGFAVAKGEPVAKPHPRAWVQIAAVSLSQTQNTMKLFQGLFSKACIAKHSIDPGKETIYAYDGQKTIQAVTSSPKSLEGNRPTLVIKNEALTLDTPIPSPSGWTTMGELKDGDVIYGADGQPTTVIKAHEVQHGRDCYRVTFGDGDSVVASDGHLWPIRVANNRACTTKRLTTREMFEAGREFWLPDLPDSLATDEADLPVDPYILGLWLGDGKKTSAQIACDPRDIDEVLTEVRQCGVADPKITGARGMHISLSASSVRGPDGTSVQSNLRALGLLGNKHIPDIYLRASLDQRLALLQGLFDSDGSIRDNGAARFCNANVRLMDQTRELLLSVGYDIKRPTYQVRDADRWPDRAHWQPMGYISVVAYAERPLFRLARKAAKMRSGPRPPRSRKIAKIERVESVPVRCISVSSDGVVAERPEGSEEEAIEAYYSGTESRTFLAGVGMHATCQTHHWLANNDGHEMAKVIRRNSAKAKGGQARTLSITNAFDPSEDSVARQERTAYDLIQGGLAEEVGMMYDSLEAPKAARLKPLFPDDDKGAEDNGVAHIPAEVKSRLIRKYITRVLEVVRGDAWWLDIPGLIDEILDSQTTASESRRFYYNQITAVEDSWVDPGAVDAAISMMAQELRQISSGESRDQLEAGWLASPDEPIVMFGDMSKSDDSTGLVGCRLSDGYCFVIGVWQKPSGERGKGWLAPRSAVDERVNEAFKRFNIVAFWVDPSHTKDETDDSSYWMGMLDKWMRIYKDRLDPKHWPVKSGLQKHAVNFDMTGQDRQKAFISAAEQTVDDFETLNDIEEYSPTFEIDGHPALVNHLKNAIGHYHPAGWGTTLMKDARDSPRKIDLAVCLVGARMLRRVVLNLHEEEEQDQPGEVWGAW